MKKIIIFYHSKTGTTQQYANEIGAYLESQKIDVKVHSILEYAPEILEGADLVMLGCWTHGLMVVFQHPDKTWQRFAARLPEMPGVKLVLFTTYKFFTGSMFKKMYRYLDSKFELPELELKSRNGKLSRKDKSFLKTVTLHNSSTPFLLLGYFLALTIPFG